MAQYRAIFQNAYFKGLATAAVVTMGLAAGQAQAAPLTDAELANASGDVIITGTSSDDGTDNKWQSLTVSGTTLELKHNLTINAGASNLITADGGAATFTGKDLTINITNSSNKDTHGLSIAAAAASSGTTAKFNNITIKQGLLSINEADSADAGKVEGKVITIGSAAVEKPTVKTGEPNAVVTLGKSGSLGIEATASGDLSKLTTLTLNADGQIKAISGDTVTNTIHAAKLNINGGSILVEAKNDGTSGSQLTLNIVSGDMTGGKISITSGASTSLNFIEHDITSGTKLLDKKFNATGGNIVLGSNLTISGAGTVVINGAKAYATTEAAAIELKDNAIYKTSLADLNGLLTGKNGTEAYATDAKSGSFLITSGTLAITGSDTVELNKDLKFAKNGNAAAGTIVTSANASQATLKVDNLIISDEVTNGDKLAVVGKNLTLTSAKATGLESLSAQNVTFGDGSKAYDLKDGLTLAITKQIADPYKTDGSKVTVADSGKMTNAVTVSGTKPLAIAAGIYESNGDITLKSGSLNVGAGSSSTYSGTDAQLTLSSNDTLTLNNSGGNNSITIQGNGELSFKPDSAPNKEQSTGILDISAGELNIVNNARNMTTITVKDYGALVVNGDQALDILNMSTTPREASGAGVLLSGHGAFVVKGNLTGIDGIDVAKIKAGTQASGDKVVLSGTGNVVSANNAWFTDSGTNGLQLGHQNELVIAETLTLDAKSGGSGADFTVKNGTLLVGQSLTSNNTDKTIVIGNDTTNAATLQLGDYEVETDAYGYETIAGKQGKLESHSAESGSVGVNLKLVGKDKTDSANLNVVFGKWTAKDITAANAKINVGAADSKIQYPEGATPSLTAVKLTLGTDASLTVNAGTDATFDALTMNGASGSKMDIKGKATINGLTKVSGGNQEAGYNVTKGDITVTGRDASLTLGSKALADLDFAGNTLDANNKYLNNIALDKYAVLKLDLADTVTLNKDKIVALRKEFIKGNTGAALNSGYIHLGAAKIEGLNIDKQTNTIQWSKYKDFSDIQGGTFQDILTEDLTNAKLVVDQANVGDTVQANVGSIGIAANSITLGDTTLHNAAGNNGSFITNSTATSEDKTVGTATVAANATVGLYNGGKLGNVKLTSGTATTDTVLNIVSDKDDTNLTSITGAADTVVNVDGKTVVEKNVQNVSKLVVNKDLTVKGNVAVDFLSNDEGKVATLAAKNLTVKGAADPAKNIEFGGNLVVTNKAVFEDDTVLTGASNDVKTLEFAKNAKIAAGLTVAETLSMKTGNELFVGTPATANDAGNNAVLVVKKLDLQGATLTADPSFDKPANIVIAQQLGAANIIPNTGAQAGKLDGTIQTLQNSIVAVGVPVDDKDQAIAKAKVFDSLMTANGSLQADKVGAISYVAKTLDLASGAKLRTAKQNAEEFNKILAANTTAAAADIYIGDNAALAVDIDALNAGRGAIKFASDDAKVYAANADSSKVLIAGKLSSLQGQIDLFDTTTGNGKVTLQGANKLTVQTINGLYAYTLTGNTLNNAFDLEFQIDKAKQTFDVVSAPVQDTLLAAGADFIDYADGKKTPVLGAVAAGYSYDKASGKLMFGTTEVTDTKEKAKFDLTNSTKDVVYYNYDNALLDGILTLGNNAVDAETNARLAVFGGAPQAAIEAGASTYEAISARMGVGVSGVSAAANGQGGAIWVTPVYKSADADGFNADNKSYGADVKLYGLALGADIEVAPNFKVGGMFNVGSGDADGQGLGSNVSNDFDYYGLGLYAGYSMDAFSLVADVTYTAVDNDIEGNTDLGKVTTSIDSTNLSVGVTGQYKLSLSGMDVTPHAGLRYSMIDMDDYSTAYSQNDSDSINIFSLPVGVTIAKEYVTDTWTVKPSFDLTLTGNFGDDEVDATAKWNGYSNLSTTVKSEIMDNFTYGAAVGVSATSGNFGLGLGINYTGSSNTDEFGVNANARYMF